MKLNKARLGIVAKMETRDGLSHLLTWWDMRWSTSPYALSHYFKALASADEEVHDGALWSDALERHFCGTLLRYLIKNFNNN